MKSHHSYSYQATPNIVSYVTSCFCSGAKRLSSVRAIGCVILLFALATFLLHHLISKGGPLPSHTSERASAITVGEDHLMESLAKLNGMHCNSLKDRVDELLQIKGSVLIELRELEQQRGQLQEAVNEANARLASLRQEEGRLNTELDRLKSSVEQAVISQKELFEKNMPQITAPKSIKATQENNVILPPLSMTKVHMCQMYNCFDHSRCSLLSEFPVYFYSSDQYQVAPQALDSFIKTTVRQALGYNLHVTDTPDEACIFMVLVGEMAGGVVDRTELETNLHKLPYWNGDGRNHVLLNLAHTLYSDDLLSEVNTGRAIVIQSQFIRSHYRHNFDIVSSPLLGLSGGDLWRDLPPLVPAKRHYLMTFQGELPSLRPYLSAAGAAVASLNINGKETGETFANVFTDKKSDETDGGNTGEVLNHHLVEEVSVVEALSHFPHSSTTDKFLLQFSCQGVGGGGNEGDWQLCGREDQRTELLRSSTFSLIIAPPSHSFVSSVSVLARLFEALKQGSIPLILGGDSLQLPLGEVIDWNAASITFPKARVSELHFLLRSFNDADILLMRRQGRLFWERYLGSSQAHIDALISVIRTRLMIPPLAAAHEPSPDIFDKDFKPLQTDSIIPEPDTDENLGPIEPPFPSAVYQRNFSLSTISKYSQWNIWATPDQLYPNLPTDPILPSEAKFAGSHVGFRPIGAGAGGSGKEFSDSLGGNSPREQFTIVMLTFEREQVLVNSLARLYGLPYLNKVIVVWNSPKPPPADLKWPDIKVPIKVIKAERNSLNNRFLPYSDIETEAILSVDDDAHLRHDEIVFGFRVWREERDRVVGFPGRFHAWDSSHNAWLYNSNYSCQLSMVLTGAAFFHKSYSFVYSQVMPQAIRDKVDQFMNCEDIAMNFLVSHITRKPPLKVTSRWTFRCPGCPVSLSEDDSHFTERHQCINYFSQVYGYNPLLNTQYRVDSVLFKTRLPHDKQKCFKFI